MTNFWSIVAEFKRKPYELLDFSMNQVRVTVRLG